MFVASSLFESRFLGPWNDRAVVNTDVRGHAVLGVEFGTRTPLGQIVVSTTDPKTGLALVDTVTFAILPGRPAGGHASTPTDTSMYLDRTLHISAGGLDRLGNLVPLPATYAAASGLLLSADGTVSASAYGRLSVVTTTAAGSDTTFVSVVPHGTLLATRIEPGLAIDIVDLDGSNDRPAPWAVDYYSTQGDWTHDGNHFVASEELGYKSAQVVDMQGNYHRLRPDSLAVIDLPRFSADGLTLFFRSSQYGEYNLWRARPDGSDPARALPFATGGAGAPSPDGSAVAADTGYDDLQVFSVPDGVARSWSYAAVSPRWSPDGRWIAMYLDGSQLAILVDAMTGRRVRDLGDFVPEAWSPDSQWLVASHDGYSSVVRAADGLTIKLSPWSWPLRFTSWRPTG
jgi:hypothetical protein